LKNISLHSFKTGPKQLSITGNKLLSDDMIFGLIKNCENAQKLYLEGSDITEIPSFAFKLNNGSAKSKLKEIDLKNNKIRKIGKI
jgi:Leucine-rich repeat (LRR) protein